MSIYGAILKTCLKRLNKLNLDPRLKIKIYGERNSGTRFVRELLQNNIDNVHVCDGSFKSGTGWKHGLPNKYFLDKLDGKVIYVIIIRNLNEWLNSMYNRPYNMKRRNSFDNFISNKVAKTGDEFNDMLIYPWETSMNLIQLRYFKYNNLKKFFTENDYVIMVNLDWIQKDKGRKFIEFFCSFYGFDRYNREVKFVNKHTKSKRNVRNETYGKHQMSEDNYKKFVKQDIEDEIMKLKCKMKKKNEYFRL